MEEIDTIVIGAGPAGMMAAGMAASRGKSVLIIEKNDRYGKKLSITGKGRCNVTNDCDVDTLIANTPVNGRFLYSAFNTFSSKNTMEFFNNLGVKTKTERGSRVFPESDKAQDIVTALTDFMKSKGAIGKRGEVKSVNFDGDKVSGVTLKNGEILKSENVIITTGGVSYPLTGSTGDGYKFALGAGHTIIPPKPSLVPLVCAEKWCGDMMGLSLKNVSISLFEGDKKIYTDFGEMLFTHYGVSGPIILSASSHMKQGKNNYKIVIDLKPALDEPTLDKRIVRDLEKFSKKDFCNSLSELLPQKMIDTIVMLSGIEPHKIVSEITKTERRNLLLLLKNLTVNIKDKRPISEAIITSGGVKTSEISPSTMESKLKQGLYFAGEVIDVNAYTGGFNLQIAFSTGFLAGCNV
ncbi:MAG: NAD(P)/FAD-dependent oxidoreductase [Bacillota bacterium]|nr:NAD(P)/FAD-dependent oxidoreductase [Bacillota bacterium]